MRAVLVDAAAFWTARINSLTTDDVHAIGTVMQVSEARRSSAKFNTGSISQDAAWAIRGLSRWAQPALAGEVGTFIGRSTESILAGQIITCDVSNDCFPKSDRILTFPYQSSTVMLSWMQAERVLVDFWFFDGLLSSVDVALIRQVSRPDTVYLFDDYNGEFKGVKNVKLLQPVLPHHVLIPRAGPIESDTTLAALVPESRL